MNLRELERSNFERVLEWSQFFDKFSKVRDSEGILLENLEDHIDQDVSAEFEEAEEEPEENLQDIANLSGASCNNTIANINKFIALNPNLPLVPISRKVGNGSYDIDSDDDDIQKLLNETVPIVIEHKRRLKESGIDRILDTFDTQKIEKEMGKWLLRNYNANHSLINKKDDLKYTAPYATGFNGQKFNESYESDEESMHSVDTARYILSNQKRHGGKKQKFGSMCTTTTTIKTYCLMKSKRDALNRKYKTYPEHYEEHIKDILDRRCLSQRRTKRSDIKQFGVCAQSHNIKKRRKYLRKRVSDNHSSTDSSSSDGEIHEKYFTYRELNRKRSIKRQMTSRKRSFNCCSLYRCRCGRQCNLSTTNSSYLSSHSFDNKHRGYKKQNLDLDPRPCIRESECDCVNDEKLCNALRHLADTSTERWLVDNNETPLKDVLKIKRSQPSSVTTNLLERFETPKQNSACEISHKLKIKDDHKDIENLGVTTEIQDKLTNRLSVEKSLPNHLGLNGRLLKCETTQRKYSSDSDEDCVNINSYELNKQNIAKNILQNTLSMDKKNMSKQNITQNDNKTENKKNLTKIENNVNIDYVKKSQKYDLTLHGNISGHKDYVENSNTKETKDLREKKYKSSKEKVKNDDKTNSVSVDINQQLGNGQKLSTNQMLDKPKSRSSKNIALKKLSKNSDLLKKDLKPKKYKSKVEIAINALETNIDYDIIKQGSNKANNENEKPKTDTIQVILPKEEIQNPVLKSKTKEELRIESVEDFVHDESDKKDTFNKINVEESSKKQVQLQNWTESDECNFDSDLKLAISLSKQQFVKENQAKAEKANKKQKPNNVKDKENPTKAEKVNKKQKSNDIKDIENKTKAEKANKTQNSNDVKDIENKKKAKKVNKKLHFNDVKDIENKNNDGIQPEIKQKSVPIPTKLVSSTLSDDTFFQNSSSVCNSTAVANNIAKDRQIPTYVKSTPNNQTLNSSKSECDCTVVTSTTNDLQTLQESSDLDIGQKTKKGIIIYTPTKKTSAPAHSFSDGCFNITQDHLSNVIGERSASKFLKYYLGPRRFDANATVYYKPPMSPIMDEDTDSSADDLEYVGLFGDLYASLSKDTE